MTRRQILNLITAAAAIPAAELWTPAAKLISIPRPRPIGNWTFRKVIGKRYLCGDAYGVFWYDDRYVETRWEPFDALPPLPGPLTTEQQLRKQACFVKL